MKRTVKRVVAMIIVFTTVLPVMPINQGYDVSAQEPEYEYFYDTSHGECGENVYWEMNSDVMTISGEGEIDNVSWIFSYYDAMNWDYAKKVEIKEGITSIGDNAFDESKIESVSLPESLENIGYCAFERCEYLKEIEFTSNIKKIDSNAFINCNSLESVTIPKGVEVGMAAFSSCDNLSSVTLYCEETDTAAFARCESLETINLSGVKKIGSASFESCSSLKTINYSNDLEEIGDGAFSECISLSQFEIKSNLKKISNGAFYHCSSLKSIYIPSTVEKIGLAAFAGGTSMTEMLVSENNSFYDSRYGCNAIMETQTNTLLCGCSTTTIPNETEKIEACALAYLNNEAIVIPNNVKAIEGQAFAYNYNLKNINIPSSVETIGAQTFLNDYSLESIYIPPSVQSIDYGAFKQCKNLKSIILSNGLKFIGGNVCSECESLTDIFFIGSNEEWNAICIEQGNEGLEEILHYYSIITEDGVCLEFSLSKEETVDEGDTVNISYILYEISKKNLENEVNNLEWEVGNTSIAQTTSRGGGLKPQKIATTRDGNNIYCVSGIVEVKGIKGGNTTLVAKLDKEYSFSCNIYVTKKAQPQNTKYSISYKTNNEGVNLNECQNGSEYEGIFPNSMKLANPIIPISYSEDYKKNGNVVQKITIGIVEKNFKDNKTAWEKFKKKIDNVKDKWNQYNYKELELLCSKESFCSYDCDFMSVDEKGLSKPKLKVEGYGEIVLDKNNNMIKRSGNVLGSLVWEQKKSKQLFVYGVPVYVTIAGGAKGFMGAGLGANNINDLYLVGEIGVKPSLSLETGLGVAGVLSVGGRGECELDIKGNLDNGRLSSSGYLNINLYVHAYIAFLMDEELRWTPIKTKIWDEGNKNSKLLSNIYNDKNILLSKSKVIDVRKISQLNSWNVTTDQNNEQYTSKTMASGVLPSTLPRQYVIGDKKVMIFQTYNGDNSDNPLNNISLVYSVYEDGKWSDPTPIYDNGSSDLYYDAEVVDDKLVLVWQKESGPLLSDDSSKTGDILKEMSEKSEICYAEFDAENNSFVNQHYLTNDSECDMMPKICKKTKGNIITYVTNSQNDMLQSSGVNEINYIAIDNPEDKGTITSIDGTVDEYITYSDDDNEKHGILVSRQNNLITVLNEKCQKLCDNDDMIKFAEDGNFSSMEYLDGNVVFINDGTLVKYDTVSEDLTTHLAGQSPLGNNVCYTSYKGKEACLWSNYDDETESGQIIASIFEKGRYSEPTVIYEEKNALFKYISPVIEPDGDLNIMANVSVGDNDENTVLKNIVLKENIDSSLASAEIDENDIEDGKYALNYTLFNEGNTYIDELVVKVEDGDKTFEKTVDVEIPVGGGIADKTYVELSDGTNQREVKVSIYAKEQSDLSKSIINSTVGLRDASLSNTYETDSKNVKVISQVKNNSNKKLTGKLYVYNNPEEEEVLFSSNLIEIEPGMTKDIKYSIDFSKMKYNENDAIYLKAYFDVSEGDYYQDDNDEYIVIYKDEVESTTKKTTVPTKNYTKKPPKAKIKSLKNVKKRSLKIKIKKIRYAKKYQIQYSNNKKFKKSKSKYTRKLTYKIKGLKKNKIYYLRIRGINGNQKGKWSKIKKIKIKR